MSPALRLAVIGAVLVLPGLASGPAHASDGWVAPSPESALHNQCVWVRSPTVLFPGSKPIHVEPGAVWVADCP